MALFNHKNIQELEHFYKINLIYIVTYLIIFLNIFLKKNITQV